jgi:hypothetical protein
MRTLSLFNGAAPLIHIEDHHRCLDDVYTSRPFMRLPTPLPPAKIAHPDAWAACPPLVHESRSLLYGLTRRVE